MNLGVGVYIFMLQRVSIGILRFFATYIWHFLGYAIAFHIIMPRDGAFLSLTDTIIKVGILILYKYLAKSIKKST